jgi:hypothetical protein
VDTEGPGTDAVPATVAGVAVAFVPPTAAGSNSSETPREPVAVDDAVAVRLPVVAPAEMTSEATSMEAFVAAAAWPPASPTSVIPPGAVQVMNTPFVADRPACAVTNSIESVDDCDGASTEVVAAPCVVEPTVPSIGVDVSAFDTFTGSTASRPDVQVTVGSVSPDCHAR